MISEAHCIDCLDFMKQQPDKRFDLVVADPPYGDPNNIIRGGGAIRCHATSWLHRMPTAIISQEDKAVQAVP